MLYKNLFENEFVKEVLANEPATFTENQSLISRIKHGDKKAQEEFIIRNGRRVLSIIDEYNFDADIQPDLFQIGSMALLEAAMETDETQPSWFSFHFDRWILKEIGEFVRENYELVGMPVYCTGNKKRALKFFEYKETLPYMDIEEMSKTLDISEKELKKILDLRPDHVEAEDDSLDKILDILALREELNKRIERLSDKEKKVVFMRVFGSYTLTEVGDMLGGFSKERVRQIEAKGMRKLRHRLGDMF